MTRIKNFLLSLFFLTAFSFNGNSSGPQKANILFVFAGQLLSQDLSCYGGININTPNMDRLAEEGLLMSNAISTYPICSPFRGMLLTGSLSVAPWYFQKRPPAKP
jgi:uncharacterized sulfatase